MKIAYFDCQSGISGDMILGALVDAGVKIADLEKGLSSLKLKGYKLRASKVKRGQIGGSKVDVVLDPKNNQPHSRHLADIESLIQKSKLPQQVKDQSVGVFRRLGKAEARVHRTRIEKVHFHEVGAVDSIVDIVGGVYGLHLLGIEKVLASSLNTGEGTVQCEHGLMPVPAPATLELLKGVPCYSSGVRKELTTPTGAAMIVHFADKFESMPLLKIIKTGNGAGDYEIPSQPNLLRMIVGETNESSHETITLMETNVDDMNPEFYDHVMDQLFDAGAVDVFMTPIHMKKNRPAVTVSVLLPPEKRDGIARILLTETSSFGLRFRDMNRIVLKRESVILDTRYGKIAVKIGRWEGQVVQRAPEYEACRKAARKVGKSIKEVYEETLKCARGKIK